MFYVRRAAGAYFRYAHAHKALHWRAWPKPWGLGDGAISPDLRAISPWELSRTYTYLRSSTSSLLRAADHGATHCAAALTPRPSPLAPRAKLDWPRSPLWQVRADCGACDERSRTMAGLTSCRRRNSARRSRTLRCGRIPRSTAPTRTVFGMQVYSRCHDSGAWIDRRAERRVLYWYFRTLCNGRRGRHEPRRRRRSQAVGERALRQGAVCGGGGRVHGGDRPVDGAPRSRRPLRQQERSQAQDRRREDSCARARPHAMAYCSACGRAGAESRASFDRRSRQARSPTPSGPCSSRRRTRRATFVVGRLSVRLARPGARRRR